MRVVVRLLDPEGEALDERELELEPGGMPATSLPLFQHVHISSPATLQMCRIEISAPRVPAVEELRAALLSVVMEARGDGFDVAVARVAAGDVPSVSSGDDYRPAGDLVDEALEMLLRGDFGA